MLREYDQRQVFLLGEQIEGFEEGSLELGDLIHRSEALLDVLQHVDETFAKQYRSLVGDLEICYAVSLENKDPDLDWRNREELRPILRAMKRLLGAMRS
jgi:hypothetical protein